MVDELATAIQKVALDTVSARRPAEALDALFSAGPDQVETALDQSKTVVATSSGDTISEVADATTSEVANDHADIKSKDVVDPIAVDASTGETAKTQEPSK